jgi:PGF-CTERM protein
MSGVAMRGSPIETDTLSSVLTAIIVAFIVVTSAFTGVAFADHGWPEWEHNYEDQGGDQIQNRMNIYLSDHSPGADGASRWYEVIAEEPNLPAEEDDYRATMDKIEYTADPWASDCQLEDLDDLGIDYGNTYEGEKEKDESAFQYVKTAGTNRINDTEYYVEEYGEYPLWGPDTDANYMQGLTPTTFYDEDDVGSQLKFYRPTRVYVSMSGCFTNPTEPGWYRMYIDARYNLTNDDQTYQFQYVSNWVPICEGCEDEQTARNKLGPPPNENSGEDPDTPTPTPDEPDGETTPTPTPDEPDGDDTTTPDGTDGTMGADDEETPPQGDGPGFGALAAVLAMIAAAFVVNRR